MNTAKIIGVIISIVLFLALMPVVVKFTDGADTICTQTTTQTTTTTTTTTEELELLDFVLQVYRIEEKLPENVFDYFVVNKVNLHSIIIDEIEFHFGNNTYGQNVYILVDDNTSLLITLLGVDVFQLQYSGTHEWSSGRRLLQGYAIVFQDVDIGAQYFDAPYNITLVYAE